MLLVIKLKQKDINFYNPMTNKCIISCDLVFDEKNAWKCNVKPVCSISFHKKMLKVLKKQKLMVMV